MQTLKQLLILFLFILLMALPSSAQKNQPTISKSYPHLVMKTSYSTQLQAKAKEIEKKISVKTKLPATNKLSPAALKNLTSAGDFFAAYQSVNAIVGPMFFPANHRTYLRIGEYKSGLPPIKDQVVSAFFNETEQSSLMADKDFSKNNIIKSQLSKDNVAAWHIETAGSAGFKISTTGTKKYLCVKRTAGSGTEQISLTTDPTDLTTNWTIFNSAENGITFYNRTYNVFLGRRTQGRKIFLLAFPFKGYGNEALRKVVLLSWDLYNSAPPTENACISANYSHSLRYVLSKPQADADGDGHISTLCGGDDCDDNDASKYPGNAEFCDPDGHDEDCNGTTSGFVDNDGDGYSSLSCFQLINGVLTSQGQDCDDNNAAIYPGQQKFIDEKTVEVCAVGIFEVEPGFKAVKQPNGTAIVIPKTN
jgi:hypothetical protein